MNEEELDELLADGEAKEQQRRDREAVRAYEIKRERRLEEAFHELNVLPDKFHRETGEYPEYDNWPFCDPPPANYWRWYAKRMINVADVIDVDGWKANLDELEIVETNGRIALGLLHHAMNGDVDSLAKKIEKAIMRVEDGPEAKAWLVVRIVRMLTNPPKTSENETEPSPVPSEVVSRENPNEASAVPKMSTEEVIERLLCRMDAGDKFSSRRQLAKDIDSSYYRVDVAFKSTPRLQAWERTRAWKRRTHALTDKSQARHQKVNDQDDPLDKLIAQEEAEIRLRKLIERATDARKAEYLAIQSECNGNASVTLLRIKQKSDDNYNRVVDRR
ncbi:hypothetical protein [Blastopirellula retiformator]|uniref:Uncharacterized protein n=1 Tax=Blastopirellula retiformator TaxID=2527970 RepID=A0A5C5UXF1_9BACT|nr:hypothetical protein [Blastopirellula retiformator]TWT30132.1 hypothetical protein Enr8_47910 [Blastopirellula retiformator]